MEFSKYKLVKNWYETENYKVYDHNNQYCGSAVKQGFLNVTRHWFDVNGAVVFQFVKRGWSYDFDLVRHGVVEATVYRSSWGKPQFTLKIAKGISYYITVRSWDKVYEFTNVDGVRVALCSAESSSLNNIGIAVSPEIDSTLVVAAMMVICRIQFVIRGAG